LTAETILDDEILIEIIEEKDVILRERLKQDLTRQAKAVGVKVQFETLVKAFEKKEKELLSAEKKPRQDSFENYTEFDGEYPNLYCGNWIATDEGIKTYTMFGECLACYHPILPIERLRNIETGIEKIKIAFKRNNKWRDMIVDKDIIASANKIVALSNLGIAVTSENAKYLVRYLSDIENFNDDTISTKISTSKMGWLNGEFMPYNDDVMFDGNDRFKDTFESIREQGDYDTWLDLVKGIRATKRIEPKMSLAASFASVLLKICGALPFFVNLWGLTEGGKTVSLMLAASVWADPGENKYIGDFKSTDVAIEIKMDFLNNLPVMLDDTSRVSSKIKDNFEGFIYDLCSGKGKSRSNKSLGINRENHWNNVILTNGERPLSSDKLQGGAINRILDLEVGATNIYEDGNQVSTVLKNNFGFAGKRFIEILNVLGKETILDIQKAMLEEISNKGKMEKQSISLSILLAADRIATDFIFKDGEYINLTDAEQVLVDREVVSDNERCYEYILGEVAVNGSKFRVSKDKSDEDMTGNGYGETWGEINEKDCLVVILNNIFEKICASGNYSSKSFLSWAEKKHLIVSQSGKKTKVKRINGALTRCIWLKFKPDEEDGFLPVEQEEVLPFM